MRSLIINFAIAAAMTGVFMAMVGTQVGMALSASRQSAQTTVVDALTPAHDGLRASHHPRV